MTTSLTRSAFLLAAGLGLCYGGCVRSDGTDGDSSSGARRAATDAVLTKEKQYERQRHRMVREQIQRRGITHKPLLAAMRKVPRHRFVPESVAEDAYRDGAQRIGHGQTISQPYVVAFMTAALQLDGDEKVLEIGTGSGYQAAILGEVAREVFTIEIVNPLAKRAAKVLAEMGYRNVHVRSGDGYRGWPEKAPFDAIMVTAAPDHVPQPLLDQLKVGGRMILPVGDLFQELVVIEKTASGVTKRSVLPVRFVPMTGEARRR